jgi:hypothetical protein
MFKRNILFYFFLKKMLKGLGLQEDPYTAKYENVGCIMRITNRNI